MKRMRFFIGALLIVFAVVLWTQMSKSSFAQRRALSPGPPGVLSGKDHRVPITWLDSPTECASGDYGRKFILDGRERYYEVHLPKEYTREKSYPVVMVLHGGGGFASMMRTMSGMDSLADKDGFIVLYGAGTNERFSDRRLFWNVRSNEKPDDVAYIRYLLKELPAYFSIDKDRVYAIGTSNGAQMTYRVAAELSEHIAAVATIAGQRATDEFARTPTKPVPLVHFHGRGDTWCPINGGPGRAPRGTPSYKFRPVEDVIASWASNNRSHPKPQESKVGKAARRFVFAAQEGGADTELWILEDAGHTWPGGPPPSRFQQKNGVGGTNRDISASTVAWEFFKRHSLKPAGEAG